MNKRKATAICALIMTTIFAVSACGSVADKGANLPKPSESVVKEIEKYNNEADKNGMTVIDMSKEPYFLTKQDGAKYAKAETITYYSHAAGKERKANVLLPNDYDKNKEYPVLYLLHGLGGSHNTWLNKDADIIIQNLCYFEKVPEMITVFPNCAVNVEDVDEEEKGKLEEVVEGFDKTEQDLVESLMPYIKEHYSVKEGKENTAIAGNSMGGRNSLYTAFTHQDKFGYIGAFSSARVLDAKKGKSVMGALLDDFDIAKNADGFEKILICVGKQDDVCGAESYIIRDRLEHNKIEHVFYDMDGGHDDDVWQNALYNYLKMIF